MPTDYREFAKTVKNKYPEYKDVDDLELAKKMVEKYPTYKSQVTFDTVKKKEKSVSASNGVGPTISSVIKGKGTPQSSGSSAYGKAEGFYSAPGNELSVYKKQGKDWYKDEKRTGKFELVQGDDVDKRVSNLEKYAKKLYDPTYEENTSWQPATSKEKEKKIVPSLSKQLAQETFKEEFFVTPKSGMSSSEQVDFVSKEKAKRDLGDNADQEELLNLEQKYKSSETLKMLKRKGYDVDVNGDINDPKSKKALSEFDAKEII